MTAHYAEPFSTAQEAWDAGKALLAKTIIQMGYAPDFDAANAAAEAMMHHDLEFAVLVCEAAWLDKDLAAARNSNDKGLAHMLDCMTQAAKREMIQLTKTYGAENPRVKQSKAKEAQA